MKKKRSGFTLIELLAVIVILGLLMAIAIPSVTKYITQSRKKTLVSTIGNYISAAVNEVNDLTYTFTESNTIYALPIECISLERGGNDPFGAWHQANDSYWAYVLVQYDDETSSYTYGYTFKDSAGYGLYPTSQSKLNESGKQIQTGLDLNQPKLGKAIKTAKVENWNGFKVDSETNLVVLVAESDGNVGDGKTTCTLQQKGDNYATVEEDKKVAGDTVYLKGGIYRETLIPKNNGRPSRPIIYKAYNNEKVVISALNEVGTLSDDGEFLTAQIEALELEIRTARDIIENAVNEKQAILDKYL